jgi:hypothetical protein
MDLNFIIRGSIPCQLQTASMSQSEIAPRCSACSIAQPKDDARLDRFEIRHTPQPKKARIRFRESGTVWDIRPVKVLGAVEVRKDFRTINVQWIGAMRPLEPLS